MAPRILVSACEPSADRYAANVAREIKAAEPAAELFGCGGQAMARAGVDVVCDSGALAVTGLFEAVSRVGAALSMLRRVEALAKERRADCALLLDSPDFNLRLAGRLKNAGIPVVYYICPQVWAWRSGRVKTIRKVVDRMLVIFPFEEGWLRQRGVAAEFVGHPLLDESPEARPASERDNLVGLLPGSRMNEVGRHIAPMLDAAELLAARAPGMRFVIPVASGLDASCFKGALKGRRIEVRLTDEPVFGALGRARAAVTASGTATVELALLGVPMVVVYKMNPITHAAGRMLVKVEHIAMVNILSDGRVAKELIQKDATAGNICAGLLEILDDAGGYEARILELSAVRRLLGRSGAARRVGEEVLKLCHD